MGNLWTFGHVVSHTLPPDRVLCIYFYLLSLSLALSTPRTYSDTSALRCGELFPAGVVKRLLPSAAFTIVVFHVHFL